MRSRAGFAAFAAFAAGLAPAFGAPPDLLAGLGWPGRLAAGRDPDGGRDGFRFFFEAMVGEVSSGFTYHRPMLTVGDKAPSFTLPAIDGGEAVTDPWTEGPTVLAFFKVSCPVCKMVAPMLTKLAEGGARVVAVGQDPPETIAEYNESQRQQVPSLSEPAPYEVSESYGLEAVPTLFLVGPDGNIQEALAGWSRDTWNKLAANLGLAEPLSTPDDGLRPFRPG